MRLRVKVLGQPASGPLRVELPCTATWAELGAAVAEQCKWEPSASLQFSLNKKDTLQAEDSDTLNSVGLASGDLLWVVAPEGAALPEPECKRLKEGSSTGAVGTATAAAGGSLAAPGSSSRAEAGAGAPAAAAAAPPPNDEAAFEGADPLPPSQTVPSHLLRVLQQNEAAVRRPMDVLVLAAHAAMLETGFHPDWACSSGASPYTLPPRCWPSTSICRLAYALPAAASGPLVPCATLQCSLMGASMVAAASTPGGHIRHLSLSAFTFVQPAALLSGDTPSTSSTNDSGGGSVRLESGTLLLIRCQHQHSLGGAALRQLWTQLKDGLAFPMLLGAFAEAGLPPPAGLLALPESVKQSIVEQLGATDLAALCCSCAELRHLGSQGDLWRPHFVRDFPLASSYYKTQAEKRGYKWAYGQCTRDRRQREEAVRRQRARFMPSVPHFGVPHPSFYPPTHGPRFPGITGGDYDRLPQPFVGGGPGGLGMLAFGGAPGGTGGLGLAPGGGGRRQGLGSGGFRMF